ncbi:oligopeptide/dipeptide ABC transporter ATP-binding protein [Labrys okinawensis]|uniref:oligopeptide/dipeptide ABC transporter ATP-binding protein n=1 Tax=Labrys okinawensis TaxID=346911 RepID=UPI0039BD6C63
MACLSGPWMAEEYTGVKIRASEVSVHPLLWWRHPSLSAIPLPDPVSERQRSRATLEGEPPDPASFPAGCRFHKRCPRASELCQREDPALREVARDHQAACHHMLNT